MCDGECCYGQLKSSAAMLRACGVLSSDGYNVGPDSSGLCPVLYVFLCVYAGSEAPCCGLLRVTSSKTTALHD